MDPSLGPTFYAYEPSQVFYSLIIYMAAFYIVAFLSSTISEELKKKKSELIQKQVDYNQLEAFNRNIIQSLDSGLLHDRSQWKDQFLQPNRRKDLESERRRIEKYLHL